ncbi:hypothetical protein GH714_043929 [Hevea brasiliensis]|uniref:Uncharacterized protein n=1 Tax=Hevea brasiliensis TaxID=3981 RepID=A0A6A6K2R0_HEVBR|nr:hypothetical protein GH714_043929 [Hevea brasiliensis]
MKAHVPSTPGWKEDFNNLPGNIRRALIDTSFNMGKGFLNNNPTANAWFKKGDYQAGFIQLLTASNENGKRSKGVLVRRASAYNMAGGGEWPKISKVDVQEDGTMRVKFSGDKSSINPEMRKIISDDGWLLVKRGKPGSLHERSTADNRVGWDVVQDRDYAPTYDQIAQQQRAIEEKQNSARMIEVALDDTQLLAGGKRIFDRHMQDYQPDPNFAISDDQFGDIRREFGDEQAREITDGVKSAGELNDRMGYYREDIKRKQELSSYGLAGVGVALVSSALDPVGWAAAAATGPIGVGAKLTQIGRVARMAAIGGIENAAMESLMYAGDTQKSIDDVFVAGGFGGLMGGTIGALTRARVKPERTLHDEITPDYEGKPNTTPQPDEDLRYTVEGADDFDASAKRAVEDAADYDAWLAARANTLPEEFDVKMGIADHVDTLQKAANLRPTRAEKATIKQHISDTEDRINFLKQQMIDERASVAAERGAPRSKADVINNEVSRREAQAAELGLRNRKVEEFDVQQHVAKALEDMRAERKARLIDEHPPVSHALDNETATTTDSRTPEENPFSNKDDSIGAARVAGSDVEHGLSA